MKKRLQDGGFLQTYHAIVAIPRSQPEMNPGTKGEPAHRIIIGWDKRKDKVLSSFNRLVRSGNHRVNVDEQVVCLTKAFVTPPRLREGAATTPLDIPPPADV